MMCLKKVKNEHLMDNCKRFKCKANLLSYKIHKGHSFQFYIDIAKPFYCIKSL